MGKQKSVTINSGKEGTIYEI